MARRDTNCSSQCISLFSKSGGVMLLAFPLVLALPRPTSFNPAVGLGYRPDYSLPATFSHPNRRSQSACQARPPRVGRGIQERGIGIAPSLLERSHMEVVGRKRLELSA